MPTLKNLVLKYNREKHKIHKRLREFKHAGKSSDKNIFAELCFCLLTPQSKAVNCDKAIKILRRENLLFKGTESALRDRLRALTRFHKKKAAYLVNARKFFGNGKKFILKDRLNPRDILTTREWLVKNIKGVGYKEASHFLRNIGFGKDIAILDRHILENLKRLNIIKKTPKTLGKNAYLGIENKMRKFAKKMQIPLEALDLLFWSDETGFIFK